jgi:hypothetical protein
MPVPHHTSWRYWTLRQAVDRMHSQVTSYKELIKRIIEAIPLF